MTSEARQWRNTLRWSTNGYFFQTFGQQWALYLGDISCYIVPGFTLSAAQFDLNNIISKEACRVFVLRCHSASHLTCFVSFHRVHLSYAIIQLYSHTNHIHSYIHTIIHSYINTFTHIYAYTTYTYMVASVTQSLVWSYPFVSVFKSFQAASPKKKRTA